jgi:hypothetical protein
MYSTIEPTTSSNRTTSDVSSTPVHILGQALHLSWITQTSTWREAWMFHVIFFSLLFSLLAIYAVYGVVRSQVRKEKVIRIIAYIVHVLIGVLGLTRLLTLSVFSSEITATSVRNRLAVLSRIIFGIGFPCITAAFALVQISFTEALKGKLSESKLGNFTFIGLVISFHFLIVLVVDTLTTIVSSLVVLFFATKFYFLIMTSVTMVMILYSGCRVLSEVTEHQRALSDMSQHYGATISRERSESNAERDMKKSLRKVRIILFLTSIFCSIICAMEVYSIAELAELLAGKDGALAPWSWYIYQTSFRLAELGMAATILYTMAPQDQSENKSNFGDKNLSTWKNIFKKEIKNKNNQGVKNDEDVHPMAVLNRAYDLRTDG